MSHDQAGCQMNCAVLWDLSCFTADAWNELQKTWVRPYANSYLLNMHKETETISVTVNCVPKDVSFTVNLL